VALLPRYYVRGEFVGEIKHTRDAGKEGKSQTYRKAATVKMSEWEVYKHSVGFTARVSVFAKAWLQGSYS
jgi:hypothetical protein